MAIVQISQITVRKGLEENLPQLAGGEFGWSQDTRQLYIGNGSLEEGAPVIGNTEILTEFSDIIALNTTYTYKGQAAGYTVQTGPTAGNPVVQSLQSWLDQFATVKDFGAVGDGVADDTDAINRALNQLFCREINPQIRRSLFFPAGTYRVTSSIAIPTYATLWGEGADSSRIVLDSTLDSTAVAYVARTADSLQQTGVNIGSNNATTPQYITITNMGFENTDALTDVFLVQDAYNCTFRNVGFFGPLTQTNLTTEGDFTTCIAFASTTNLVCEQIVFDACTFKGTVYGVSTDQQLKGVTVSNSNFDTLYRGVNLGTGSPVLGGPTGVRIVGNVFDHIYAEGVVFGEISLNATGHNVFYDVGNHFGGTTTPYTAVIDIQGNNNVSISDLFERGDQYSQLNDPGTSYTRVALNDTESIATVNGAKLAVGTYTRFAGNVVSMASNTSGTAFTYNTRESHTLGFNYTIARDDLAYRNGSISIATNPVLSWTDTYTESTSTGVTLDVSQAGNIVSVTYTVDSDPVTAVFRYSITRLAAPL